MIDQRGSISLHSVLPGGCNADPEGAQGCFQSSREEWLHVG